MAGLVQDLAALEAKQITAEEAAALVRPGARVFLGTACATPRTILTALEARVPPPPDVCLYHFVTTGAYDASQSAAKTNYYHRVFFVGTDMKPFLPSGAADYVPMRLSEVPRLLENGRIGIDIAFIQVSPPDRNGYVSLGVSVDITMAMVRNARMVVAEVNPNMPDTCGDTHVHMSQIDHVVMVDTPLPSFRHVVADDLAQRIAQYIAGIIDDGSTLQIGLGRIPNEALRYLMKRRDLGIHSDVITDSIVDLIRSGAVTGAAKTQHRGKIVTSYCIGSEELYRLVDRNPMFEFLPIEQVCDPAKIAANHRMVSITQAFGIDLTGQTSVDQFDGVFYGGVSTQPDFMRGTSRAKHGKPIIAMTSTTEDEKSSCIRPFLTRADGVGIARSDVHYVVTEHGIAYLFGKSIQERALALIEIAHPKFREELLEQAKALGYVTPGQRPIRTGAYRIEDERTVELRSGRKVMIRPARASDARSLQRLFHRLPPQDVFTRFFQRLKFLSFSDAQNLSNVDQDGDVAFVAVTGPREDETVVASGCYFLNRASNLAETAFIVDPEWQGGGLGSALQDRLREIAQSRGVRGFVAEVLTSNEKMLRLARAASSKVTIDRDDDCYHITMLF